ncbi:MAG: MFS transporter [Bacillota bacterium]
MRTLTAWRSRRAMDLMVLDGLFTALSGGFVSFMTPFLLHMGAGRGHISLLSSLQSLTGSVLQVPFARLTEAIGQRKKLCVVAGAASRLCWVMILLVPFYLQGQPAVRAVMGLMVVISVCGALAGPAWTSIMAALVPREQRGRFFATRNVVAGMGTLAAVPIASRLIARRGFPAGFQLSIVVSLALGLVAFMSFLRILEPPYDLPKPQLVRGFMSTGWRKAGSSLFARYVFSTTAMGLAAGIAGPFCSIYAVQVLEAGVVHLGYYTMAGTTAALLSQRVWGHFSDRRGPGPAVVISGFSVAASSFLWFASTARWHPIAAEIVGGLAWGGWGLATFNLLLELTPDDRRPSYVAIYGLFSGVAATLAPLAGTLLIGIVGFRQIFLLSTVLRLLAAESLRRAVR